MNYQILLLYLVSGLIIITAVDTLGAIASRKFNFNYFYLSIASLVLYVAMGFIVSKKFDFSQIVTINGLLGLYDGTIGLWFSLKLKAKTTIPPEKAAEMTGPKTAIPMVILAIILGAVGFGISKL